jgi:23S rRNA (guanine2535-N1)-methyltransferase
MQYRYATGHVLARLRDINRVVRNAPGFTALPARLVAELVGRAKEHLRRPAKKLLDPCCGGAGSLATIGMLLGDEVDLIGANDVSERALILARKNLSLLGEHGLEERERELAILAERFGKSVHQEGLLATQALRGQRQDQQGPRIDIRQVDIGLPGALARAFHPVRYDLVFTDLPYGQRVEWESSTAGSPEMLTTLLEACHDITDTESVIVAVAPRRMRAKLVAGFQSLGRNRGAGGREIHFFRRSK